MESPSQKPQEKLPGLYSRLSIDCNVLDLSQKSDSSVKVSLSENDLS